MSVGLKAAIVPEHRRIICGGTTRGNGTSVPSLFGRRGYRSGTPTFSHAVNNLLSSEAICGDKITLWPKPFSAGAPEWTTPGELTSRLSRRHVLPS